MEQRNFDRARRKQLLAEMSPEEIVADKKRLIFRFLQDELNEYRGYESATETSDEDDPGDVFDSLSEQEEPDEQSSRLNSAGGLFGSNEDVDPMIEIALTKERKRIFDRHRFDIVKESFNPFTDMDQLRKYKKVFKIEMEEHPERYTLRTKDDGKAGGEAAPGVNVKQVKKRAED